jgi:hypothetical protein
MDVLEWLLEPDEPSVRYRTLNELLDLGETKEAEPIVIRPPSASSPTPKRAGAHLDPVIVAAAAGSRRRDWTGRIPQA